MTPITFLGKRYYIVKAFEEGSCDGCALETYQECPQNTGPRTGMCDNEPDVILIPRTKAAVAAYVTKRLEQA